MAVVALCACGRPRFTPAHWSAQLGWGSDVSVGWESDTQVGPLAAAASPDALAVADSFGHRVLLWRRGARTWQGPLVLAVPSTAPLVAVALEATGGIVADADGGVWSVRVGAPAVLAANLRAAPGEFRRVLSIAALPDGATAAELVTVTSQRSSREIVGIASGGPPRTLLTASLAWADPHPQVSDEQWMTPTGYRSALAGTASGGMWVAVRGPSGRGAQLVRLGAAGRVVQRRPLPQSVPTPVDFLGVDPLGRGYLLAAAGTGRARLISFDRTARSTRGMALPRGTGPRLPHPVAVSSDGALLVMTAQEGSLRLDWWAAGKLPQASG